MQISYSIGVLVLSYLLGAIPMGLLIVKIATGQDIRNIHSGRTGGTNAMRAAGFWAGFSTALFDIFKGAGAVWLVRWFVPGSHWLAAFAPILAIIGHNYSIFLLEKDKNGRWHLRGGAGGATAVGGATGLWFPNIFILVPIGVVFLFGVGYASLATMSVPLAATIVFGIRAALGLSPWHYVIYGILAEALLLWSLRPNIKRLLNGTERLVGWRAQRAKRRQSTDRLENTQNLSGA